jgi:hypothetical protein
MGNRDHTPFLNRNGREARTTDAGSLHQPLQDLRAAPLLLFFFIKDKEKGRAAVLINNNYTYQSAFFFLNKSA